MSAARQDIGPTARRHLARLWDESPWIFSAPTSDVLPVRHNVRRSFLVHLREAVAGQVVEELWVMSPFYDREAVALERLLAELNPARVTVLLQPGRASVDPAALRRVLDGCSGQVHVRPFSVVENECYVHAKVYVLKLADRALCLHGSPNLSPVAMLFAGAEANIETANFLAGPRDAFDDLLTTLAIGADVASLDDLDLSYHTDDVMEVDDVPPWLLLGGEWHDDLLDLRYRGPFPALHNAHLAIGHVLFPLECVGEEPSTLRVRLSDAATALLVRAVPVRIRWTDSEATEESNSIFVCNKAALEAMLDVGGEDNTLDRIGSLDLDDIEFEQLLDQLNDALMIDQQSVWQTLQRPPVDVNGDGEEQPLDYASVDYDALRRHPKMQQYLRDTASQGRAISPPSHPEQHHRSFPGVSRRLYQPSAPRHRCDESGGECSRDRG